MTTLKKIISLFLTIWICHIFFVIAGMLLSFLIYLMLGDLFLDNFLKKVFYYSIFTISLIITFIFMILYLAVINAFISKSLLNKKLKIITCFITAISLITVLLMFGYNHFSVFMYLGHKHFPSILFQPFTLSYYILVINDILYVKYKYILLLSFIAPSLIILTSIMDYFFSHDLTEEKQFFTVDPDLLVKITCKHIIGLSIPAGKNITLLFKSQALQYKVDDNLMVTPINQMKNITLHKETIIDGDQDTKTIGMRLATAIYKIRIVHEQSIKNDILVTWEPCKMVRTMAELDENLCKLKHTIDLIHTKSSTFGDTFRL